MKKDKIQKVATQKDIVPSETFNKTLSKRMKHPKKYKLLMFWHWVE